MTHAVGDRTFTSSYQYLDDGLTTGPSDIDTATVSVSDDDTGAGSASTSVTVNNVIPVVTIGTDLIIMEGETVTDTVSYSDVGTLDALWSYLIGWGEGASITGDSALQSDLFTVSHTYEVSGVFIATACFTDKNGGLGCSSRTITVLSAAAAAQLLEDTILALGLSGGTKASLTSALDVASSAFDAGRTTPGVKLVESFIIRVEAATGRRIDAEDAEVLIDLANRIIDSVTS